MKVLEIAVAMAGIVCRLRKSTELSRIITTELLVWLDTVCEFSSDTPTAVVGSMLLRSCTLAKSMLLIFTYSENTRVAVISARLRLKSSSRGDEVSGMRSDVRVAIAVLTSFTKFPPFPLTSDTAVEFMEMKVFPICVASPSCIWRAAKSARLNTRFSTVESA